MKKQRVLWMDALRVVATLGVVMLHVSAQNWASADIGGDFRIFNFYDSLVRWSVPVFVMISGALFLERDYPISVLLEKYVLRIVTAFLFWSALYAMIDYGQGYTAREVLLRFLQGHYHMWFLFMIVGLYLIVPFLRKIVESEKLTVYFLLLSLVFAILLPQVRTVSKILYPPLSNLLYKVLDNAAFHFTLGYSGYFVMGYYLKKREVSPAARSVVYGLAVAAVLATYLSTNVLSRMQGKAVEIFYGNMTVPTMVESAAIFLLFRYGGQRFHAGDGVRGVILKLSEYSFGIYLVHALVLEQLRSLLGIDTLSFDPLFSVPVITAGVFVIAAVISAVLHRIPGVKKYLV